MKVKYRLEESDYLDYQLFFVSKSERINKARKRNRLIIPLVYLGFGVILFFLESYYLSAAIVFFGLLWYFMYPIREKNKYIKNFKNHFNDYFKTKFERDFTIEINDDFILGNDGESDSKVPVSEIEEINEIPSLILLKLKTGDSFLLPKNTIPEIEEVKSKLKEIASKQNISYNIENEWSWR